MPEFNVISVAQAKKLVAARDTLKAIEDDIRSLSWDDKIGRSDVLSFGRVAEAADIAEAAVFNVLNLLSSHLHDEVAGRALFPKEEPKL